MRRFANKTKPWLNWIMKNTDINVKDQIISRYLTKNKQNDLPKSTNINVLLNRVKLNQKNESRKKIYFSAVASMGLVLFGVLIF
jgi:hypothetical protein